MSKNNKQQMELQLVITKQNFFDNFNSKPKQNKIPIAICSYLNLSLYVLLMIIASHLATSSLMFFLTPKLAPLALWTPLLFSYIVFTTKYQTSKACPSCCYAYIWSKNWNDHKNNEKEKEEESNEEEEKWHITMKAKLF